MTFSMLLFWFRFFDSRIYFWACKENCASFIKHVGPTQGAILRSGSIGLIQLYDIFSYQMFWLKDLLLNITRQICVLKISLANFRNHILHKYCKSDWDDAELRNFYTVISVIFRNSGMVLQRKFGFDEVWYSEPADAISPKLRGNEILRRTEGSVWCINLQYIYITVWKSCSAYGPSTFMDKRVKKLPSKCRRPQHDMLLCKLIKTSFGRTQF